MFTPLIRVHSIAKGLDFKIVFCSVFGLVARESHSYLEAFDDALMNGDVDDVVISSRGRKPYLEFKMTKWVIFGKIFLFQTVNGGLFSRG